MVLLGVAGMARAGIYNGSFESWDLVGWNLQVDEGLRALAPLARSAGNARTVSTWGEAQGFSTAQTPVSGGRFLALSTRANANFLGNDTYDIVVSQTFALTQGEGLSGWSFFFSKDSEPLDSVWVRVLGGGQQSLGTIWTQTSGSPGQTLAPTIPAWQQWHWFAPSSGEYTLQLGMTTSGANNGASYGGFDGITITAQAVPEPTAMVLGILGGGAFLMLRQRNT
jgi:hypothetical protein